MSKTSNYLQEKALNRLNEINRILERYETDNNNGNILLNESLKILRKERKVILETKLRDYKYENNSINNKSNTNNKTNLPFKSDNLNIKKILIFEKGREEFFSIDKLVATNIIKSALQNSKEYIPSHINKKLFKTVQYELNKILNKHPSKYELIKNRYSELEKKYFYWIKNNKEILLNKTDIKEDSKPLNIKLFNENRKLIPNKSDENITNITYIRIEINDIEHLIRQLNVDESLGNIKLRSIKLNYNNKINSIKSKLNKVSKEERDIFENQITKIQDKFSNFISMQESISDKNINLSNKNIETNIPKPIKPTEPPENLILNLGWKDIIFRDGFISFWGWERCSYPCELSQASYNRIKNFISLKRECRFQAEIDSLNNKIVCVIGLEILDEIFELLNLKISLDNYKIGNIEYFINNIIGKISNQNIINIFSLDTSKSQYLDYLCQRQDQNYKIIPVNENRSFNANNSLISEYVFLFAIRGNFGKSYIIWESLEISRATHIFECNHENYAYAFQKIFDYIQSPDITNKRQLLHRSKISYFSGVVKYLGSNNHDYIIDWISRIKRICR